MFVSHEEKLFQETEKNLRSFVTATAGNLIQPLTLPLLLPESFVMRVRQGMESFLSLQSKVAHKMLSKHSRRKLLLDFGVETEFHPFCEQILDQQVSRQILRFDVLIDSSFQPKFCEVNVDSSVGGGEAVEFARIISDGFHLMSDSTISPYEKIANLLRNKIVENNLKKVVVIDWSRWVESGYFSYDTMKTYISEITVGVPVHFATEKTANLMVDSSTLVFRLFLSDDARNHANFLHDIFKKAGTVTCDFSGDLWGSKLWLALFHELMRAGELAEEEAKFVADFIPPTNVLCPENCADLLLNKDRFFFKKIDSYGGLGVLHGATHTTAELENIIFRSMELGCSKWIAQEEVVCPKMPLVPLGFRQSIPCNTVLGFYLVDGSLTGPLVRAKVDGAVVNVAGGSCMMGWGHVVSDRKFKEFCKEFDS